MKKPIKYKIIKDLDQYNTYCDKHESMVREDEAKYADEIELLEVLIENYDQRVMKEKSDGLNPVELLRSLLTTSNLTQSELSKSMNVSRQLISDILGYRRNISKEMTIKLSKFFSMSQEAFSRDYDLKAGKEKMKKNKGETSHNG